MAELAEAVGLCDVDIKHFDGDVRIRGLSKETFRKVLGECSGEERDS